MEIHPDFEDPEENEWVLPSLPNPTSVPENTKNLGVLYFWRGLPRSRQWPVSAAITREITPPWRRGFGIMLRTAHRAYALGVWLPGKEPHILSGSPVEKDWHQVVARANDLESKS